MSYATIIHTAIAFPPYSYNHHEVLPYLEQWVCNLPPESKKRALTIFKNTFVEKRHGIAPIAELFKKRTLTKSNQLYKETIIDISAHALQKALHQAQWKASEINLIITTSCTGVMLPSFDAYLVNKLQMSTNIKRLPITEIGCVAGVAAYAYAYDYLKAYPQHKVAIISAEFPSNTIQLDDFSMDNIVGTIIFADGVACSLLTGNAAGVQILDHESLQIPNTTKILGYDLYSEGLRLVLNKRLPFIIEESIHPLLAGILKRQKLSLNDIDDFLIHPGGTKIIERIEKSLNRSMSDSREVMSTYGNLSSATIGVILNQYMKRMRYASPRKIMLLGFGPGLTAYALYCNYVGTNEREQEREEKREQ
ncbi:MAG: hypothetical protein HQK52_12595 [Oligoflexia bacterium]|nr:hypothetical protein [Oligoflexia bacterium]